jgi:hypothetical protein
VVLPLPNVTTVKMVANGHTYEIFRIKALGHECSLLAGCCRIQLGAIGRELHVAESSS